MIWIKLSLLAAAVMSNAAFAEAPSDESGATETELPDDPEIKQRVDAESAELEEMRALEESAMSRGLSVDESVLQTMRGLGAGNPVRQRLQDALGALES